MQSAQQPRPIGVRASDASTGRLKSVGITEKLQRVMWANYIELIFLFVFINRVLNFYTSPLPTKGERGCLPGNVQHRVNALRSHFLFTISSAL